MRTVSERLYFICWHFSDPEKNLGATVAAVIFVQQPTAFVLVATWYVVAFWSHTKMVRNFAKRSALDCAARERPEETARVRNDGQMTSLGPNGLMRDACMCMHNKSHDQNDCIL